MIRNREVVVFSTLATAAILSMSADAQVLSQPKHYEISTRACVDMKMPGSFCNRLAVGDHNVDHNQWHEMAAHAQRPDGVSRCEGANLSIQYAHDRARRLRNGLLALRTQLDDKRGVDAIETVKTLASNYGQLLHAVQDNCSHAGMTNPQHAWLGLDSLCRGADTDPDSEDAAIQCASQETKALMETFLDAMADANVIARELALYRKDTVGFPSRDDACEYYASANSWDGKDTRWNTEVMLPAMRAAIVDGLTTENEAIDDVCQGREDAVDPVNPKDVDTSGGQPVCKEVQLACKGSVDDMNGEQRDDGQGCSSAIPGAADAGVFALLFAVFAARRRR